MRKRERSVFLVILLLCFLNLLVFADDKAFVIKINGEGSMDFHAAMASKTGDLVLAWSSQDERGQHFKSVYSAYVKLKKNGKFKTSKIVRVTPLDEESRSDPSIAYNSATKSFFLAWYGVLPTDYGTIKYSYLEGVPLNSKGRKKGEPYKFIREETFSDSNPEIVSLEGEAFSDIGNASYAVTFYSYRGDGNYPSLIDVDGKPLQEAIRFYEDESDALKRVLRTPESLIIGQDGKLYQLSKSRYEIGDETIYESILTRLGVDGSFDSNTYLANRHAREPLLETKKGNFLTAVQNENFEVEVKKISSKAKVKLRKRGNKPFKNYPMRMDVEKMVFVTTDTGRTYLVCKYLFTFLIVEINAAGKPIGEVLSIEDYLEYDFYAFPVKGSNRILLTIVRYRDSQRQGKDIVGILVDP